MTAAEVMERFRLELESDPELEPLVLMAGALFQQAPEALVQTMDAIVVRYCRAREASIKIPEVTKA